MPSVKSASHWKVVGGWMKLKLLKTITNEDIEKARFHGVKMKYAQLGERKVWFFIKDRLDGRIEKAIASKTPAEWEAKKQKESEERSAQREKANQQYDLYLSIAKLSNNAANSQFAREIACQMMDNAITAR